jgi:hypothetical protein
MKVLNVKSKGVLPSIQTIVDFENQNRINLPFDYKWFLLTQNPISVIESDILDYEVNCFYPIGCTDSSLEETFAILNHFFESRFVPFAYDSGGWQFVICIEKGENYGKVYFCRMDEELDKALTLLANSFDDFINKLEENPS